MAKPTQAHPVNPSASQIVPDEGPVSKEPVTTAPAEVVEEPQKAIVLATSVSEASPVSGSKLGSKYLPILPERYHRSLNGLRDPSEQEILAAANSLSADLRDNFTNWLDALLAEKVGFHADTVPFRVPDLRIFQGSGNDSARPENAIKGCVYDSDGNLITAPSPIAAKNLKVPERFNGFVLAAHATRLFWYPKDEKGNPLPMAGIAEGTVNTNVPLCTSMDRSVGTRYGDCSTCVYRPFATGKGRKNECKDAWVFYVMRDDFSTVYRVPVVSTSTKTGATPIIQRIKGTSWRYPWSRSFTFETMMASKGNTSWFQWKSYVNADADFPQGILTPKEHLLTLELLARKIDAVVYYPALADAYVRSQQRAAGTSVEHADGPSSLADQVAGTSIDQDPAANF